MTLSAASGSGSLTAVRKIKAIPAVRGLYQVSRDIANSLVGTLEQWGNKTILDTVHAIGNATGAKAVRLEGQPELTDLPIGALVGKS